MTSEPKKNHPTYLEMVKTAILAIDEFHGSTKAKITNYLIAHHDLPKNRQIINNHVSGAIRKGVAEKTFAEEGTGTVKRFRMFNRPKKYTRLPLKAARMSAPLDPVPRRRSASTRRVKKPMATGKAARPPTGPTAVAKSPVKSAMKTSSSITSGASKKTHGAANSSSATLTGPIRASRGNPAKTASSANRANATTTVRSAAPKAAVTKATAAPLTVNKTKATKAVPGTTMASKVPEKKALPSARAKVPAHPRLIMTVPSRTVAKPIKTEPPEEDDMPSMLAEASDLEEPAPIQNMVTNTLKTAKPTVPKVPKSAMKKSSPVKKQPARKAPTRGGKIAI